MTQLNKNTGLPYLPEDLTMRLGGCVILFKSRPVRVEDVQLEPKLDGGWSVLLKVLYLEDCSKESVLLPNRHIDVRPVATGYVNYEGEALYLTRKPVRKYKQGLHSTNISVKNGRFNLIRKMNDMLCSKGLHDCIINKYPTMKEAIKTVGKSSEGSVAFHRRWAVSVDDAGIHYLNYRGVVVGVVDADRFILGNSYGFLSEEIGRML